MEAEAVQKAEGGVDIAVDCAEFVNLFGPVGIGVIGYIDDFFFFFWWFLRYFFIKFIIMMLWVRGVSEEEGKW